MENIAIQTSQNVAIEQPVASIGERIGAAAIDYIILAVYYFLVFYLGDIEEAPLATLLFMIPALFYHLVCEMAMNGQSWGKRLLNIKVVKIDGTRPGFSSYLIRWIFRIVDVLFLFGAISTLVIIINGKGQRLGDIVANTTVIRVEDESFDDSIFSGLPNNYTLKFPQVSRLNDTDLATAREVVEFLKESIYSIESMEIAKKARKAIETKMGVQSELGNEKFLKTVINDYNYLHSR